MVWSKSEGSFRKFVGPSIKVSSNSDVILAALFEAIFPVIHGSLLSPKHSFRILAHIADVNLESGCVDAFPIVFSIAVVVVVFVYASVVVVVDSRGNSRVDDAIDVPQFQSIFVGAIDSSLMSTAGSRPMNFQM